MEILGKRLNQNRKNYVKIFVEIVECSQWSYFLFVPDDFIDCTANIDKYVNYELGEEKEEKTAQTMIFFCKLPP